ncbi:IS3 family transposase [Kitasatospora sp. NPDC017646]|uniref:IS3 family transposase n=1 Tax=Kitasatospora sp. NPDC017646 TaxID=3364024 RepID=UPI0037A143DC
MGRTGICCDNAAAESFFGLLKAEIGTTVWESREAARADVFHFIEVEYNRTRLRKHPEFGYLTPLEARARLQHDFTPAAQEPVSKIRVELHPWSGRGGGTARSPDRPAAPASFAPSLPCLQSPPPARPRCPHSPAVATRPAPRPPRRSARRGVRSPGRRAPSASGRGWRRGP